VVRTERAYLTTHDRDIIHIAQKLPRGATLLARFLPPRLGVPPDREDHDCGVSRLRAWDAHDV